MIKLTFCLTRLPGMTRPQFQDYWRDRHAPLVMAHADALGFARYVQSHTISDAARLPLAAIRGSAGLDYDGVAQFWWTDMATLAAAGATPEGQRAGELLLEDERRFIDLSRSPIFLSNDIAIAD
jgi:uncharacterized protein (TIGR02118 family)